jgi:phospholipid/cholesterol/gamma-HCH transport system substrate-binding protein
MSGGAAAGASKPGGFGRVAAVGALVLAIIAIAWIIFGGGDDGYEYELVFETGGQLVPDNQVLIGGSPVGSVDSIELNDDGQAEVAITVDRQLHQGSSAVIRSTSLSGVANRYVSITPGPDNAPGLDSGSVITQVDTTTPVDLDQLFNALRAPERKGLQDFIQGSATVYAGRGEEANETYRYLSPALTATDRLIQEINRDSQVLSDFLVSGARVTGAVAERRDDLVGLVSNTNQALGAVAERNEELDRSLVALPPALRQANTTFFNLRLALDDLDPLVETVRTDTKDLAPFLRQFNKVAGKSRPVFKNLRIAVNKKGKNNDLTDATGKLPAIQKAAARASGPSVQAMIDSEPVFSFIRPYSPDLFGALGKLGQLAGYYDANGHYLRVQPAGLGTFRYNTGTNQLEPDFAINDVFDPYGVPFAAGSDLNIYNRCPGGVTQAALDGSNPFLDPLGPGLTTPVPPAGNDCNATDLPPGP